MAPLRRTLALGLLGLGAARLQLRGPASAGTDLQSVQSLGELNEMDTTLNQLVKEGRLNPEMQKEAKKVVASVDSVAHDIEAGKVQGKAQHQKVAGAIQELVGLEHDLSNATVAQGAVSNATGAKMAVLEHELALKQADLKVAELEKQLLEKKLQLKKLELEQKVLVSEQGSMKARAEQSAEQQKEELADKASVSRLVEAAKVLVVAAAPSNKAVATKGKEAKAPASSPQLSPKMEAILSALGDRMQSTQASLKLLDAQEARSQAALKQTVGRSRPGSPQAGVQEQEVQWVANHQRRAYLKARMMKALELKELSDSMDKIKAGDVAGLSALSHELQVEMTEMQVTSKNFLH